MFSVDALLDRAVKAQVRYEALLQQFPPGTINSDRNDARKEMDQALACARWMEKQGITELMHVGPFVQFTLQKGSIVRIRKGARIFSNSPSAPREGVVSQRTQQVKVHSFDRGYVDERGDEAAIVQPNVHWAGASGYWRWTDVNNVEVGGPPEADLAARTF